MITQQDLTDLYEWARDIDFPVKKAPTIDGYSNKYWGWGFEDDDLLFRCKEAGLLTDSKFFGIDKSNLFSYLKFRKTKSK